MKTQHEGSIVGIVAVKGGVGKTTTTANLGAVLANEFSKRVLIVDANFSAPNLGLHVGVANPQYTIHDILRDTIPAHDAIITLPSGFDIICGAAEKGRINPYKLKNRLDALRKNYDVILIDSSPTMNEELLSTMLASDEVLVVANADYPTLSCTLQAIKSAQKKQARIKGIVLNKVHKREFEIPADKIEAATQVPVIALLPHDLHTLSALAAMTPVTMHTTHSKLSRGYKQLGALVLGVPYEERWQDKIRGWLT